MESSDTLKYYYAAILTTHEMFAELVKTYKPYSFKPSMNDGYDIYAVFKFEKDMIEDMVTNPTDNIKLLHYKEWKDVSEMPSRDFRDRGRRIYRRGGRGRGFGGFRSSEIKTGRFKDIDTSAIDAYQRGLEKGLELAKSKK